MKQFNKPNLDNLQDYINKQESMGSDIRWWNIPRGTSSIRVLPPWDPTGRLALGVYSHRIEYRAPDSNYTKYSWTCVHRTFGKPCNICAGLERLKESGVSVDEYLPNTLTYYINALVMFDPEYDNAQKMGRNTEGTMAPYSHVLMRIPKTVYTWIVNQVTSPLIGDITDPVNGIDIIITKEGTGLSTKYSMTLSPNGKTAIPEEVLNSIDLYNLDDIFNTGFEDDRVSQMIGSLNRSAANMSQNMGQVQQSMGGIPNYGAVPQGYGTPTMNLQQTMVPPQPTIPSPQYTPVQQTHTTGMPVPSPQIGHSAQIFPQQPVQPSMQSVHNPVGNPSPNNQTPTQAPTGVNYPKCFGQYNPSSVNCVVCNYEIECSRGGN